MNNIIIPFEFFLLKLFLKIRIVLIFPLNFLIQNPYLLRLLNITLPKYKEKNLYYFRYNQFRFK